MICTRRAQRNPASRGRAETYSLEPRVGCLAPHDRTGASNLPISRAGDGVRLDRALVQRGVCAANVELRAGL